MTTQKHNSTPSPTRIRSSDIQQSIFQPKDNRVRSHEVKEDGVIVYTISGKENGKDNNGNPLLYDIEYDDNDILLAEKRDEAYAKVTVGTDRNRYYVKFGPNGKILNPLSVFNETRKVKMRGGESQWKYREVNKKVFDLYLSFLKTKNKAWLSNAEREAI